MAGNPMDCIPDIISRRTRGEKRKLKLSLDALEEERASYRKKKEESAVPTHTISDEQDDCQILFLSPELVERMEKMNLKSPSSPSTSSTSNCSSSQEAQIINQHFQLEVSLPSKVVFPQDPLIQIKNHDLGLGLASIDMDQADFSSSVSSCTTDTPIPSLMAPPSPSTSFASSGGPESRPQGGMFVSQSLVPMHHGFTPRDRARDLLPQLEMTPQPMSLLVFVPVPAWMYYVPSRY